jgi:hypothetical protein
MHATASIRTRGTLMLLCGATLAAVHGVAAAETMGAATQVLEQHGNAARSGLYVVPALTWDAATHLRRDPDFQAEIAGPVYAQPLYWRIPGTERALLLVTSEQNIVYALDARNGALVWKTSIGAPVPHSVLPCGNINPLGITGTPVIDPRSQTLLLGAMVTDQAAHAPRHRIFALSLKDGTVLPGWPIDVEAALKASGKTFLSPVQNQRGALTVLGNTVYVPYGGHWGDCGDYRGWVVSVSLDPGHAVHSWSTGARAGGIWASGGISSDGTAIYAATGNTMGAKQWSDGEAIIRLGADLTFAENAQNFFTPSNWQQLDDADADLGGSNPLLLSLPTASQRMLALGKDGRAYLLGLPKLGGIGGEIVSKRVSPGAIRTSPAYFTAGDATYVAMQATGSDCPAGTKGDLTVLKIVGASAPTLTTAWCAVMNGRGSPIVTTTDGQANPIVWVIGAEGDNRLHGFRGDTGAVIFAGGATAEAMTEVRRFQTLIAIGRHLYVAADDRVYAFTF